MNNEKIQELRISRNMPLALCARLSGITIMELWRIETIPGYEISSSLRGKLLKILAPDNTAQIA